MIFLLCVVGLVGTALGFLWGRTIEWQRVLRYIHRHEDDRAPWWIAAGIAADCHWRGDRG